MTKRKCWPWAHIWTRWQRRPAVVVPSVYPHADGRPREVMNTYIHRTCRACGATQEYLYNCHVREVGLARAA